MMVPSVSCRRLSIRGVLFTGLVSAVLSITVATAQVLNGRSITSFYTWQQFDTVNSSKTLVRGFESVLLDIAQGDFALHTHVQAASMLQDGLGKDKEFRLFNLYGQWRDIGDAVDLSFGRLPYYAGAGNGTLDGLLTTLRLFEKKLRLTAYGGANVPLDLAVDDWGPLAHNFTLGGQVITTAIPDVRLGVSFVSRQRSRPGYVGIRPDALFNPVSQYIELDPLKEQLVSSDVAYWVSNLYFYGRYDYNVKTKKTQRGQAGVRYSMSDRLSISADFIHRAPRVMYNSFFTVFNASSVDELEAGADYMITPSVRAFGRFGYVDYVDDRSFRYTCGVAHQYISLTYRGGAGYAGELNSASLQGSYPLLDYLLVPTVGVSYLTYKLGDSEKNEDAFSGIVGATVRPLQTLSVDVQGQWLTNKIYKHDVRLFARLNFWFTQRLNIFE